MFRFGWFFQPNSQTGTRLKSVTVAPLCVFAVRKHKSLMQSPTVRERAGRGVRVEYESENLPGGALCRVVLALWNSGTSVGQLPIEDIQCLLSPTEDYLS